jgi:5-methyltetrahydropteroyltriglutamate--homocysteine methyltransferase
MTSTIPTTHVGSLPREQAVVDQLFAREHDDPAFDQETFDETMAAAVDAVVARQAELGIDWVSDGEMSKISYATYVKDRYDGFGGESPRNAPADLKKFPSFLKRLAESGGTPKYSRPQCIGEVRPKEGNQDLVKDIANLRAAIDKHGAQRGFMNAASPGVISLFLPNDYYPSREAYLGALADVMRDEYRTIIDAGFDLQVDCPDLALSRHMLFADLSDEAFVKIADGHVEALNAALDGLPRERVRVHICWGNYEGPHVCDVDLATMLPSLLRVKANHILFETANPRHGHEWSVFEEQRHALPDDLILVPGVIDSTTNFVEHPELVKQRVERFLGIVGRDRVAAGTDCGFGTFAGFGAVDPEIAYAKLGSLVEGTRRA